MAQLEEDGTGRRVLEVLTENGRLFNYTSISEMLRFRLVTKRMNLKARCSRKFRENPIVMGKNIVWPRVETQAIAPPVEWTRITFAQFPLENAPASFCDYWRNTMVDRVRVIDLVQVRVHCDYIYRVLSNVVHLEEINFDKVSWIANIQLTLHNGRVRNIKNLCQFSHGIRLLGRGEATIRKISISRNHIMPICVLNLLRHRSQGRLQQFAFNGGKLDDDQKGMYAPQWARIAETLDLIVSQNYATLTKLELKDFVDCTQFLTTMDESYRTYLDTENAPVQLTLSELNLHKTPNPPAEVLRNLPHVPTNIPHLHILQEQSANLARVSLSLPNMTPNDAQRLENFLRASNNLTSLTLIVTNCAEILNLNYMSEPEVLPRVKVLEIYDINKEEANLDHGFLQNFPHPETLEAIGFNGNFLPKVQLLEFFLNFPPKGVNHLEKLTLLDGKSCDNEVMKIIIQKFDKMREIRINNSPTLGDVGLTGLAEKLVKKVNCDKSYGLFLKNDVKRTESSISQLKNITKLDFKGCPKVTDLSLIVAFQFDQLREVNLTKCVYVTNVGLQFLAKNNPALEKVTIIKNSRVDYNGVSSMIGARPTISTVFSTLKNLRVGTGDFTTDVHDNLVMRKVFLGKKK